MAFRQRSVSDVGLTNGRAPRDSLKLPGGQYAPPEITGTLNISPRTPREDMPISQLYANIRAKHEKNEGLKTNGSTDIIENTKFSASF